MAEVVSQREPRVLEYAAQLLHAGELVAFPTDTVYGLGAEARNEGAVRKLFAVKGRALSKAVPLLLADSLMATWVAEVTPVASNLMSQLWPGALTLVLRRNPTFHSLALGGGETVAVRVPDHDFVRELVRALGEPVTGTSANRSGARSPVSAAEVAFQLGDMVALVVDGGRSARAVESTVLDLTAEGGPKVLREGAVGRGEIERVLGKAVA